MKIAILSDSHDNLATWEIALKFLEQEGITTIIHCGDVSSADMLLRMAMDFDGHIHVVEGNTDNGLRLKFILSLSKDSGNNHKPSTPVAVGDLLSGNKLFPERVPPKAGRVEGLNGELPSNVHFYGEVGTIELDGKKISWCHYPALAEKLAKSGTYDVVFYGHDHKAWEKTIGKTKLFNPGTLAGMFAKPSFAVYDTINNQATLKLLERL